MHRNDGPNFEPDIGGGKRGFIDQNLPGTPGSTLASLFNNAIQEEICGLIEDVDMVLAPSGAADQTAGWVQLKEAVRRQARKGGVWVDATRHGLSTAAGAGTPNKNAIQAAFAISNYVFIPAGNYELTGNIVVPDGGVLAGAGVSTVLNGVNTGMTWIVSDRNTTFENLTITSTGTLQNILVGHTLDRSTIIRNCTFPGSTSNTPILVTTPGNGAGLLAVYGCRFGAGLTRSIEISTAAAECPTMDIQGNKFESTLGHFSNTATSRKNYRNNIFKDLTIFIEDKDSFFENNEFQGAITWDLDGCDNTFIRNNTFENTPTVSPSNTPRYYFNNNRNLEGKLPTGLENINGVYIKAQRNTNQVVPDSSVENILFDTGGAAQMSFHPNYTTDTVYDSPTGVFTCRGLGNGKVRIQAQILLDTVPTADVEIFLKTDALGDDFFLAKSPKDSGSLYFIDKEVYLNEGDTVFLEIHNNSGGNCVVISDLDTVNSNISVEGL